MSTFLEVGGIIISALAIGVAFYCWRHATLLQGLLIEASKRFETIRGAREKAEKELQKAQSRLQDVQERLQRMEKNQNGSQERLSVEVTQLQERLESNAKKLHSAELQLEAAKADGVAMREQLAEADRERSLALADAGRLKSQLAAALQKSSELERQRAESERQQVEAKSNEEKTEALKTNLQVLERKLKQSEALYSSMRGLREMSEERNRNWEVALRALAAAVLDLKLGKKDRHIEALPIGPLVGEALEAIGVKLVHDPEDAAAANLPKDLEKPGATAVVS